MDVEKDTDKEGKGPLAKLSAIELVKYGMNDAQGAYDEACRRKVEAREKIVDLEKQIGRQHSKLADSDTVIETVSAFSKDKELLPYPRAATASPPAGGDKSKEKSKDKAKEAA